MDRKQQLANVAFGGAWSEQIAGNEALRDAMLRVARAAAETIEVDLRGNDTVDAALHALAAAHPKGALLVGAWRRALDITNPGLRQAELTRVAVGLRAGLGDRVV